MKWWWSRERRIVDYEFNRLLRYYANAYKNHQSKPGEWIKMCDKCKCSCTCTTGFKKVDWSKPIQTDAGNTARRVGERKDTGGHTHIIAVDHGDGKTEQVFIVDDYGCVGGFRVQNVPEKMVRPIRYTVLYADGSGIVQSASTMKDLQAFSKPRYIIMKTVSETAVPEEAARRIFKEWIDA